MFFLKQMKSNTVSQMPKSSKAPISVVICAKDEGDNLKKNLPAILEQDYPDFEVVLVDDGSTDDSKAYIHSLQNKYKNLRYEYVSSDEKKGIGKKYALQKGIKSSRNEWIALTDADCYPSSKFWLKELSKTISNKKSIGLGYGGYEYQPTFLNSIVQFDTIYTYVQYAGFASLGFPYMGVGRNLFYSKEVFTKNNGLDDIMHKTSGDDDLFINKVITKTNHRIVYSPDGITLSSPSDSFAEYYRQKNRHYSVSNSYKKRHIFLLSALHFSSFSVQISFLLLCLAFSPYYLACYLIRLLLLIFSIKTIAKHFGVKTHFLSFLFLDIIWVSHYLVFSVSLFRGDVKKW